MRQCTSVTDRGTDGLASWHKREKARDVYITSRAKNEISGKMIKIESEYVAVRVLEKLKFIKKYEDGIKQCKDYFNKHINSGKTRNARQSLAYISLGAAVLPIASSSKAKLC